MRKIVTEYGVTPYRPWSEERRDAARLRAAKYKKSPETEPERKPRDRRSEWTEERKQIARERTERQIARRSRYTKKLLQAELSLLKAARRALRHGAPIGEALRLDGAIDALKSVLK